MATPPAPATPECRSGRPHGGIILHHRDPGDVQLATLRVENARGNDRAEDVEVYVDVGWEFEPVALLPLVEQEPLPYGDPRTVPPPPQSRSVAAGFARWLPLFMLGEAGRLANAGGISPDALPDGCLGAVAIARFPQEPAWLIADQEYFIAIGITGANFDAVFYAGRFLLEATEMDIEGGLTSIELKWTHALKRTKPDEPPSRLVATP